MSTLVPTLFPNSAQNNAYTTTTLPPSISTFTSTKSALDAAGELVVEDTAEKMRLEMAEVMAHDAVDETVVLAMCAPLTSEGTAEGIKVESAMVLMEMV